MAARSGALPRRSVLPGGLRVVSERVPGLRSVALGIWVGVGSRDERASQHGCSHFLEHLLFKGTARRSALQISSMMDAVGGEMNAFTTREATCFHARVLSGDLPLAVDVVTDLVTASLVSAADVEVERGVILEELAMNDDDPDDGVHDLFARALWGDSALGRTVLGTAESITAMTRSQIVGFYRRRYDLSRMVVTASGDVEHDQLLALVSAAFGARLDGPAEPAPLRPVAPAPAVAARVLQQERDTEQVHLVLGTSGLRYGDPRIEALQVLSGGLGGGMSSRLFQSVREQRGLAYSVHTVTSSYADTGLFGVYAGCAPAKLEQVVDLVRAELAAVAENGLTEEEVRRAQAPMRAAMVLDLEDSGSRMLRLGYAELLDGELLTIDAELARIEAVTPDDVRAVAADVLSRPLSLALIGSAGRIDLEGAVA
ncbi:MAG: insulinase family protein [Frankiales bacterium]|nr:insulinase family protein [Frankiales bacterium]